jgi:transposase
VSHAYDLKRLAVDSFDEYGEVVVPDCVRVALRPLVFQIDALDEAIGVIDKEIAMSVKADETAKRLMTVPGVGPVTASAIMATIQDMGDFASGREFAAFLGLTPRQSSTGGKPRLGRITKMGDRYEQRNVALRMCPQPGIDFRSECRKMVPAALQLLFERPVRKWPTSQSNPTASSATCTATRDPSPSGPTAPTE